MRVPLDLPPEADDHELVRVVENGDAGLRAVIAIHSTVLGPAMGGVRRTAYPSFAHAVSDALQLSRAMTLKNSAAGLPLGGGKSVIVHEEREPSNKLLDAFAEAVQAIDGRYVAAEDIGTTPAHMDRLALTTKWVAGRSTAEGGSGDPSPATAQTVFGAMRAAVEILWGKPDVDGRSIGVLGVGKVGARLASLAANGGARVLVADIDGERAKAVADANDGARAIEPRALLVGPLDILAPCATGGVVSPGIAGSLGARIVCGAANNVLLADSVADELAAKDILYVPDFLANSGGIIQVGGEFLGWDRGTILKYVDKAIAQSGEVLEEARRRGTTPLSVAYEVACARLRRLG